MLGIAPWMERPMEMLRRAETPFGWMAEEFPALFNRLTSRLPMMELPEEEVNTRRLTTEENEKEYIIRVELPGFGPSEVRVELLGERLTIEAEHREPAEEGAEAPERVHARVRRVVTLPPEIESERIEAVYRNGVLEVHLPRRPEAVGRRIEVRT